MAIVTKQKDTIEYLQAEGLCVPHCFTTRLGGVSTGHLSSLNIGIHRGDTPENVAENYRILGDLLGITTENFVVTRQTHSDIIRKVGRSDRGNALLSGASPECDGLITNEPGVALVVFTADCTPILLHDPKTGAVGAVHAGWRGTAAGIAAKAVDAMVENYGCNPEDICAAIGPNIGQCCFETGEDVPLAMTAALGSDAQDSIRKAGSKYYVNLKELNALWLRRTGVAHIEISSDCTACQPHRFWSHRITGGLRGSQGAVILCKGGCL